MDGASDLLTAIVYLCGLSYLRDVLRTHGTGYAAGFVLLLIGEFGTEASPLPTLLGVCGREVLPTGTDICLYMLGGDALISRDVAQGISKPGRLTAATIRNVG